MKRSDKGVVSMIGQAFRWGRELVHAEMQSGAWHDAGRKMVRGLQANVDKSVLAKVEQVVSVFWPIDLTSDPEIQEHVSSKRPDAVQSDAQRVYPSATSAASHSPKAHAKRPAAKRIVQRASTQKIDVSDLREAGSRVTGDSPSNGDGSVAGRRRVSAFSHTNG